MSEPARVERLAPNVTLYLGDCREILPTLPRPAAVISDPPYGQRLNTNIVGKGASRDLRIQQWRKPTGGRVKVKAATIWPEGIAGDGEDFDPRHLLGFADIVLLWGAHRFGHYLPPGTTLVWDKVPTGKIRDQGDGETAWLNTHPPRPLRIYRLLWDGVCVGSAARHKVSAGQGRVHPTQKPESLMAWCIEQARVPAGATICDPYMGAGSTGVAAVRAGHGFIGIEMEPLYFDTARRRIAAALAEPRLALAPLVVQAASAPPPGLFDTPAAEPAPIAAE